jgi:hypothetical protein
MLDVRGNDYIVRFEIDGVGEEVEAFGTVADKNDFFLG